MAEGVIRNFVVALGFTTDKSKADEMKKSLEDVEVRAKILHKALLGLAVGSVVAVTKVADELDKLYFSSQRIGASANNINAYGNAIAQLGGSAEGAIGTLESLAEKLRNSPGYESQIKGLGVDTREANGEMRDRVEVMKDLSGVLAKMPAYQANAYAESLGIDQNTLLAMRDGKFMSNMEKYQKIQKELGMNDDLTKSGNEFMTEYRDLTMMTKTGFQVLVMQAGKALIPVLRLLNQLIQVGIHAFSQLNPAIKGFLTAGLQLATFGLVLNAVIKSFGMLKTGLSVIKMFIPALKAFRLAFLASPIGIILALASALYLLYDDYKTWREGGKSLFDWSKWTEGIDFIIEKIQAFLDLLDKIKDKTVEFINKVINKPAEAFENLVEGAKNTAEKVGDALANPQPDENGNVSKPRDLIAEGMDAGFGLVDKGLSALGNEDAEQRVKQREKGEIGYQAQTTVVKDIATVATNTAKAVEQAVKGVVGGAKSYFVQSYSSKKFTTDKAKVIKEVAERLGVNPNDLASVISFETAGTFDPGIKNPKSSATGLIQFMKGSGGTKGKYYGMSRNKFASLSFSEQMKYVEKYFKERGFSDKKQRNVADLYTAVTGWGYKKGSEAYRLNKVWDSNRDGFIDKGEMVQNKAFKAHQRNYFSKEKPPVISKPVITSFSPPTGNPNKSQINTSSMSASNVTIYQEYKTDMTINGASSPQASADAVKRVHDNGQTFMARSVKGVLV